MLTWAHLLTVQKKYVTKKDMYSSSTKYGKVAVSTTKYRKVAPNVAKCHKVKLCFADASPIFEPNRPLFTHFCSFYRFLIIFTTFVYHFQLLSTIFGYI